MLAMEVALSPIMPQDLDPVPADASPMVINMTPTTEQGGQEDGVKDLESGQQYDKPPPLHTGADWKIVLHLPEIETWLRMTSERVRDLTYSVQQDLDSKHVDVHLVQLKDICEDISDHVEQIHALLETEFSLKLLSYSVNVIVDIHTVQLLWHQLRVSVLVLRERILQGLQDANGNYTRQTDILQAFSEETKEDRLDSLTEVDDSGQLTIKCSQNYLSLDCGITAFELSDYSPSEDLLGALGDMSSGQAKVKPFESWSCSEMEKDFPELIRSVGLLTVATESIASKCNEGIDGKEIHLPLPTEHQDEGHRGKIAPAASTELSPPHLSGNSPLCNTSCTEKTVVSVDSKTLPDSEKQELSPVSSSGAESKSPPHCENATPKRPIRDCFDYNEDSPTQPTLPKRGFFLKEDILKTDMMVNDIKNQISLMFKTEVSKSTPSLLDPPDRSKLCLALQTAYTNCPSAISQSCDCLHNIGDRNIKYAIQNHFKESSLGLGKAGDIMRREKLRCKKSHDIPEEVASCRTAEMVTNTTSANQVRKRLASTLQNGVDFRSLPSMEGSESDSTSTSSDPCRQQELNGQYCSEREDSASPAHSQVSGSSGVSESVVSSSPVLPRNKSKKSHSSSPSSVNTNGKVVEAWYGSDEYLALPSHLKQTEVLALKLENLTKLLPQKPQGETIQNIDDWELSGMNSDSELYPTYQIKKKHKRLGRVSPSSSSDIVSSIGDSIESGPLSDILSDEDLCSSSPSIKKYLNDRLQRPPVIQSSDKNEVSTTSKSTLIQQLIQDIQHQDNYDIIWEKMEGFVSKLDEFIHWLNEAMETTENWTPPKAETDSLKLYLETHLSFKLNVDSHCALKESVVEEGCQLLDLIVSHKSGLKDMLQMISSQWKELQRQIKRQHSWILRALGIIKAEILATDVSAEEEEGTESPKAEVQLCYLEAQRDAVEQMSLKLYSEQYNSSSKRKEEFADMSKVHTVGSNGLLDFDSEYQELWDWLIDMESIVIDSHDLMMSEEQQLHLYKRYSVEMSIRHPKKMELLTKVEALKRSGVLLPNDLLEKVDSINEKWELLGKTLGEKIQDTVVGHSGLGPRDLLSPESGSLVRQLEVRIKELKGWLRDTELFIFNSCLRQESEGTINAEKQLQYFKSLCSEIKQRRRGVGSVLRLCQHLLDNQETCNLNADHQPMQLIIVNLERRWEAIVMQAVQWQTRLQRKLAKHAESLNVIDPGLMELNGTSEDSLEWDEMDISNTLISINEEFNELDQQTKQDDAKLNSASDACINDSPEREGNPDVHRNGLSIPQVAPSPGLQVYQVYSIHNVELSRSNPMSFMEKASKSPSITSSKMCATKDSSIPTKHLPGLMGSTILDNPPNYMYHRGNISRHSESQNRMIQGPEAEGVVSSEVHLQSDASGMQDNSGINIPGSKLENLADAIKQNVNREVEENQIDFQNSSEPKATENVRYLDNVTQHSPEHLEGLQGKPAALTFYDYSYLQGSKLKLPMIMKQSNSEKAHKQGSLLHGFYFDKVPFKSEHKPIELKPRAPAGEQPSATDMDDSHAKACELTEDLKKPSDTTNAKLFSALSHSSSLDSLSVASDLLGSSISRRGDGLHRSTSLESWLTPYKSNEDLFSCNGSGELSGSSDSVGELSKRTLDLLNRLENIQSPLDQKIKRSISDITLQSTSQRMSLTGQLSLDMVSSLNEDSPNSLTELSSSDDLSLCSEDIVLHKNKVPDSNASFRKHLNWSVADESDVNVSMIVNVSCTSACTDDEDDSDLLSSSTLTLTEEELGIKDEDDDSSIATDEDIYEDCNLISGLDYIKNELHTWTRPKFYLTKEKRRGNLDDEIQSCKNLTRNETLKAKDSLSIEKFLNDSIHKLAENNGNSKDTLDEQGTKKQMEKEFQVSAKGHLVDDVENGNVASTPENPKEELPAAAMNAGTLDHTGSENECICELFTDSSDDSHMDVKETAQMLNKCSSPKEHQSGLPSDGHWIKKPSAEFGSDVQGMDTPDTAILKSLQNGQQNRTGTSEDESDRCRASKPQEAGKKASASRGALCCNCESVALDKRNGEDCSVHNFVMEIIDLASTALKNKSQPDREPASPHSLAQIREKVLEHSHRPIQLRKGDFYSYLSLSSHDSDCGEVTKYVEEKSSTPVPLDFADDTENIECFFEACPEEERVEQQVEHVANVVAEVPLVNYEGLDLIGEPDSECGGFSFLDEEMDFSMPGCLSHIGSDTLKNSASTFLNLDIPNEVSVLNSLPNSCKETELEDSLGIAKSGEDLASSGKASAEASPAMTDHLKDTDVLHQDIKTLTCEENLHLHPEQHINTHT